MPILNVQMSLREVGRIRTGDQVRAGSKRAPHKLEHFRFTSTDPEPLAIIAEKYGGEVQPWTDAPAGDQYQVYTAADAIRVMIVPGLRPFTQYWETWTGAGCVRRCDGQWEHLSNVACPCADEPEVTCRPTTRLNVILPDVPGLGTWRLESHGYYAAVELGGTVELITRLVQATGEVVYATLRLTQRTQRIQGQPVRHYSVPVLDVSVTVPELAQRIAGGSSSHGVDAANSERLRALAAAQPVEPPKGFLSAQERLQAEVRGEAKAARKRGPEMGPGRRRAPAAPPDDEVQEAFGSPLSDRQRRMIMTLFRSTGLDDRDERLRFSARIIGRSINSSNELTSSEASSIIDVLAAVDQGTAEYVTDANGGIVGAQPVDVDTAHNEPLPLDPDDESE